MPTRFRLGTQEGLDKLPTLLINFGPRTTQATKPSESTQNEQPEPPEEAKAEEGGRPGSKPLRLSASLRATQSGVTQHRGEGRVSPSPWWAGEL
jgi:hypothetical protein